MENLRNDVKAKAGTITHRQAEADDSRKAIAELKDQLRKVEAKADAAKQKELDKIKEKLQKASDDAEMKQNELVKLREKLRKAVKEADMANVSFSLDLFVSC